MVLNEFLQQLKKETEQEIKRIESIEKDEVKRAYSCALALSGANSKLKNFIVSYEFENREEEIDFFKRQKPALTSRLIYYCEVYNIKMKRPVGGTRVQHEYLSGQLKQLQDYIESCPEFYRYYRLGLTDNDVYYFTRDRFEIGGQFLEPTVNERDPRYSANCDYRLAMIQATEELEILLKSELDELEHPVEESPQLPWSAKKAYLIELLYALDSFRVFGHTPLTRVISVFQHLLGIDLGNVSSEFSRMKDRNEPTPFLDGLKEALMRRMKRWR
jgi:RteC protein.